MSKKRKGAKKPENTVDTFVQVTMTPEQARAVVRALDMYLRVHIGQFNIISEQFIGAGIDTRKMEDLLFEARSLAFPGLFAGRGHSFSASGCPREDAKIAYDVLQVVRRTEALGRHPEGGMTVDFNEPLFVSGSSPRPSARLVGLLDLLAGA
ncbi:MAG: hypothetical protein AB7L09_03055 [Nitrospira sp.]